MHEVGHIVAGLYKSEVDTEFFAQLMAIGLAKKNSWTYLVKELEATFAEWADFKWNEKHGAFRRYILAGRKYKCLREKLKLN